VVVLGIPKDFSISCVEDGMEDYLASGHSVLALNHRHGEQKLYCKSITSVWSMKELSDLKLITQIAANDTLALKECYRRFHERVYNLALSHLQDKSEAEEITQDVFVKVWRHAAKFKGKSQVMTWIYRITVNASISALRKRKHRLLPLDKQLEQSNFYHPAVQLDDREKSRALYAAIYQLPHRQKSAFVLCFVEDLPRQQVADIMGLSRKSVEGLLIRAKKNLRKTLSMPLTN